MPETITAPSDHDAPALEPNGSEPRGNESSGSESPGNEPEASTGAAQPATPEPDEEPAFARLGLSEPIVRAVTEMGYQTPTPIQQQAIPYVLMGRDLLGCAQTGTGKTAGFTLPMLDILSGSRARARMPRSLILEPTRELALQVAENFVQYGKHLKLSHALVIGGESMADQKDTLMRGVDVLIATPGRLMDMFDRGTILLTDTRILVIDEADRMLDMGFIPDVERIVTMLPRTRQTLFFSATMAPEIRRLADAFLDNPKEITVAPPASVAATITEAHTLVAPTDKREALRHLIRSEDVQNALIFCNRKRDVDTLYKSLSRHGFSVGALHGDMAQPVRFTTLEKFKAGDIRLLCCSDVAARGIDIGGLSHVFNFDVPHHAEDYVHRIGRTGRAGREGRAFTLCAPEDRLNLEAIEKLIGHAIPRIQIDGLDAVEWAEDDGRRRGRGRAASARKPAAGKAPARRSPRRKADEQPNLPEISDNPPPELAPQPDIPADAPLPPDERHHDARHGGSRRDEHRRGAADQPRRPRREQGHARHSRHDDDAGPAVRGFGDDVPAFMLIPTTRPVHAPPAPAAPATDRPATEPDPAGPDPESTP